ncbi:hypothetical protein [Deinococcus yavapaiensis]|uniref:Uncharacterized protein n=1 Tax=Deinococcus yavapaiensis KR-236 TaxID=694435 RepID=A0A318S234_9DEIO|nr:hypothetical protein [Deinococcus yavapaiensis]PYE51986.1 hypothetical protein DES52_11332 [Deinococcus yavapaiensis KR-236]
MNDQSLRDVLHACAPTLRDALSVDLVMPTSALAWQYDLPDVPTPLLARELRLVVQPLITVIERDVPRTAASKTTVPVTVVLDDAELATLEPWRLRTGLKTA